MTDKVSKNRVAAALRAAADALSQGVEVSAAGTPKVTPKQFACYKKANSSGSIFKVEDVKKVKASTVKASSEHRIYVAHLGAYVAGTLRGNWIEPGTTKDEIFEQIKEALGIKGDEDYEWAIHDYDNFPDMGEYPNIEDVAKVSEMLNEHDYAMVAAALGETSNDADDAAELLKDGYAEYDDAEDFAYQFVDDMGGVDELGKDTILQYLDEDQLARTLGHEMNFVTLSDGTVVAFYAH